MVEEEEVELNEGMPVRNEEGEELGSLSGMLIAEDEEEAEFVLVTLGTADRLVPYEAVVGVADGALLLDVPAKAMELFPAMRAEMEPTDDEIDLAYQVYDEHALVGPEE